MLTMSDDKVNPSTRSIVTFTAQSREQAKQANTLKDGRQTEMSVSLDVARAQLHMHFQEVRWHCLLHCGLQSPMSV